MRKKKSVTKLKKELWTVFSQYIRLRDKGVCFTCLKVIPDYFDRYGIQKPGWKAGQAGHFITAANCGLSLYFHEQNVHCQCYHCNINLSGNWLEYERRIIQVYGNEKLTILKELKYQGLLIWKSSDYAEKIKEYKIKLANLLGES